MLVVLFRSKLTSEAGEDYVAMNNELETLVRQNAGFIDAKSYKSDDGERLTVVWWKDDKESLRAWRELPRHRTAQSTGRQKWYEYYKMEVATVERVTEFEKSSNAPTEALVEGRTIDDQSVRDRSIDDQVRGTRPLGIDSAV